MLAGSPGFTAVALVSLSLGIAIATCAYLMSELPKVTWIRFFLWMAVGLVIYFLYGARNSRLRSRASGDTDSR